MQYNIILHADTLRNGREAAMKFDSLPHPESDFRAAIGPLLESFVELAEETWRLAVKFSSVSVIAIPVTHATVAAEIALDKAGYLAFDYEGKGDSQSKPAKRLVREQRRLINLLAEMANWLKNSQNFQSLESRSAEANEEAMIRQIGLGLHAAELLVNLGEPVPQGSDARHKEWRRFRHIRNSARVALSNALAEVSRADEERIKSDQHA